MQTDTDLSGVQWLAAYMELYRTAFADERVLPRLVELRDRIVETQARGGKVIFAGNGGSAAIASHCAVDFSKTAGIRCINFNEADLITCLANDYGYEWWVEKALRLYADAGDLVVLISSSGRSPNILRAAEYARSRQLALVVLTGFDADNPLRALGDLSFWIDSRAYNVVEITHHVWLLAVCDMIVGTAEYSAVR